MNPPSGSNASPRRPFDVPASEYPFASHWFERGGTHMHYLDEGDGMPVVMLHGNTTWSFLYRKVIRELEGSCRAIVPDYPGFGFSEHPEGYGFTPQEHADWIAALVDHLALDRLVLVVHDWGGPIGMSIATRRPEAIAGLVVCNTWSWADRSPGALAVAAILGGPVGRYLILRHNAFTRWLLPLALPAESRTPEVRKAYTDPFPSPATRRATYVLPRAITRSADWLQAIEERLHLLGDRPVQLVWGMRDPAFGRERVIKRWKRHLPQAEVDRIDDAGHFMQEDHPERVAAGVRRVLSEVHGT